MAVTVGRRSDATVGTVVSTKGPNGDGGTVDSTEGREGMEVENIELARMPNHRRPCHGTGMDDRNEALALINHIGWPL